MRKMHLTENLLLKTYDTWTVFVEELRRIFHDPGIIMIFFVACLAYPVLYKCIYWKNNITDVPVAVVDMSCSPESRRFIYEWNACPEVKVAYNCANMEDAEHLLRSRKVHGIMYFPPDYAAILHGGLETAHISLYCDMSSFLFMKNVYLSANKVLLDKMYTIQIDRYRAMNMDENLSWAIVQSAPYEENTLFCPSNGYGDFLVPAVLVMIIHQTLLFGIAMLSGTACEENEAVFILPKRRRRYSILRILFGRSAAYFVVYLALASYALIFIPYVFDLPHIGQVGDILRFMIPFLLSTIFFSIALGSIQKERETGMVTMLFTSLIFLFLSGVSWPAVSLPPVWRYLGWLLPSTWGINGYLHIQSMGATLATTAREYHALWILTAVYFAVCCIIFLIGSRKHAQRAKAGLLDNDYDEKVIAEMMRQREQEMAKALGMRIEHLFKTAKEQITAPREQDRTN